MAYADQNSASRKLPSIAGVVAVHAVIGYALISGLATTVIQTVIPTFTVTSIEDTPPPPIEKEVLPPKARADRPERVTSPTQTVVTAIPAEPVIRTVEITPFPTQPTEVVVRPTVPADPVPVSKAAGAQVRGDRAAWITAEDYPAGSIRAEEEGTVAIAVRIGADGRVTACTVTGSSGHAALDAVTCRLYPRRARFTAARDAAGNPVDSSYADRVRWQLPRE